MNGWLMMMKVNLEWYCTENTVDIVCRHFIYFFILVSKNK